MSIVDIFSKRQKKLRGELPDLYVYDEIPHPLRVQIVHIWGDALGSRHDYSQETGQVRSTYNSIVEALCREYGLFQLASSNVYEGRDAFSELTKFFLATKDHERALDAIDLSFRVIDRRTRRWDYRHV